MKTQSEIFFAISSFGFVTLWILLAILIIYLIRIMHTFSRILARVEKEIDTIGDTTKEMLEDMRESTVFRFLFGKRRRGRKEKTEL